MKYDEPGMKPVGGPGWYNVFPDQKTTTIKYTEGCNWCQNNIDTDNWYSFGGRIYVKEGTDATAFKLRFSK